ncbi:alpha-ribazole phosphatase [Desulfosarcina widdelii]|uniref:Alpha-ribazole phosphatase n=1 Tax=Desulfosarcina widdelii TaxID=947919 RepID=A0A5K7Z092_9BACT|nr:alpha-ribazole phosphatase [Desulfosarcina widdelii]BBO74308.1 alpha-ribazole phosphatase [Desulfosarcina widdelii]
MKNILTSWLADDGEKKIFLLRHGSLQTADNEKRFIGQTDLSLSEKGRRQAKFWSRQLIDWPLDAIFCSDLQRCRETADVIAQKNRAVITPLAEFREINLGQWEGMRFDQVKQLYPDAFAQRGRDIAGFRPPGGESFNDLQQRVVRVFERQVGRNDGNLLFVGHAGVNRVLLCHLLGMPTANLFRIDQGPAALNILDRRPGGIRPQCVNLLPDPDL